MPQQDRLSQSCGPFSYNPNHSLINNRPAQYSHNNLSVIPETCSPQVPQMPQSPQRQQATNFQSGYNSHMNQNNSSVNGNQCSRNESGFDDSFTETEKFSFLEDVSYL